jgi:hypothetical protein
MRYIPLCLLISSSLFAQFTMTGQPNAQKIAVQNSILAKVNGTTISMIDVKKKMDMLFHQHYAHLEESPQARFQFYETSWRRVLSEMIDNELILADASDKEVKLTDGELREEVESRFGPNVMTTLDKIGITYEEAWKLVKNEMVVQRMNWWFIHSKAITKVTPQEIKQGYRLYTLDHPAYTQWKYQVLTIKGANEQAIPDALYTAIQEHKPTKETLPAFLKEFEKKHPECGLSVSSEFDSKDAELSEAHKSALALLEVGQYGAPTLQMGRDKKAVYRIFCLNGKIDFPAASFEEIAPMIKNELLQKASIEITQNYLGKLRKHYRFDSEHLKESVPENLTPFSLQ